ncbi:MAG: hypothetical protein K1X55_04955 [Chitinophagales bacterium]|nr:hypothetical protein [Chitinophagales bacterium]
MHLLLSIDWKILYAKDLFLSPLYLALIYLWAYYKKSSTYKGTDIEKYFIPALTVRMVGAVLTALMYQYYYHYGDPFSYWLCIKFCWDKILVSPETYFNVMLKPFSTYSYETMDVLGELDYFKFFRDPSTNLVIRAGLLFSLFSFNTFLPVSYFITIFAFLGSWRLFLTFSELYPKMKREVAFATLFVPSVFFWGTGVMKDPLCIGALGYFTYAVYQIFFKRKNIFTSIIWILLSIYIIASVKTYIIMSYAPAIVIWVISHYWGSISNKFVKILAGPIFVAVGLLGGVLVLKQFSSSGQKYSLEKLMETAQSTQSWLTLVSEQNDGSAYSLGIIEYTPFGLLKVAPKAINVTLFRPYPWEARKPILIPAALESLFCLLLTIYIFFKIGIFRTLRAMVNNSEVLFCMIFSLIFAFAVGFSTFNFGALVRYKIPCMPFYFLALAILYKQNHQFFQKKTKKIVKKKMVATKSSLPA